MFGEMSIKMHVNCLQLSVMPADKKNEVASSLYGHPSEPSRRIFHCKWTRIYSREDIEIHANMEGEKPHDKEPLARVCKVCSFGERE